MKLTFKTKSLVTALGFTFAALVSGTASAVQTVDASVPAYEKASGISGNLSSVGSDTLANLMTMWAEEFNREYPNVNIQIQAAGSSTAPPALTEGTANLGPMSREMKDDELAAFEDISSTRPPSANFAKVATAASGVKRLP